MARRLRRIVAWRPGPTMRGISTRSGVAMEEGPPGENTPRRNVRRVSPPRADGPGRGELPARGGGRRGVGPRGCAGGVCAGGGGGGWGRGGGAGGLLAPFFGLLGSSGRSMRLGGSCGGGWWGGAGGAGGGIGVRPAASLLSGAW